MNRHILQWLVQQVPLIALMMLRVVTPVSNAARFDWNNQQWPVGNKLPVRYINVDGSGVDFLLAYSDPNNVSQEGRPRSTANGLSLSTVANSVFEDAVAMDFQFFETGTSNPIAIRLANWNFEDIEWHPAEDVFWREQLELRSSPVSSTLRLVKPLESTVQINGTGSVVSLVNSNRDNPPPDSTSNRATLLSSTPITSLAFVSRNVSPTEVGEGLTTGEHSVILGDFNFYTEQKKHLVFVTHGFNADANTWPANAQAVMAAKIKTVHPQDDVRSFNLSELSQSVDFSPLGADGDNDTWDVVSFDWGSSALGFPETFNEPWKARAAAIRIGRRLGYILRSKGYDTAHLIGHSAGSWLIDGIADIIDSPSVDTHLTFLDAFVPYESSPAFNLGNEADWVEQYVHHGNLLFTNDTLPNAFNVDVTGLRPEQSPLEMFEGHSFPWQWYLSTTATPTAASNYGWGFQKTIEFTEKHPGHNQYRRGNRIDLISDKPKDSVVDYYAVELTSSSFDFPNAMISETGTVSDVKDGGFTLATGSPVWIDTTFELTSWAEFFRFNYDFSSAGDGQLSVFADDRLVLILDEGFTTGGQDSEWQWLGELLGPGSYQLRFELETSGPIQSIVRISNIEFGLFSAVPEPSSLLMFMLFGSLTCTSSRVRAFGSAAG